MRDGSASGRSARSRDAVLSQWLVPAMVVILTSVFGLAYLTALARPVPHRIPLAVVAPVPVTARIVGALHLNASAAINPHGYRDVRGARSALLARRVDGVLAVGSTMDTLYVAQAAGPQIATVLDQVAGTLAFQQHVPLEVRDLVPLPSGDSSGLALFYLVLACVLGGYVGTITIMAHTKPVSIGRRAIQLAATAALCGTSLVALARFVLASDPLPVSAVAVAALTVFAVAVSTWALLTVFGRLAVPVAIGFFVILGSPSSGGAIPRSLLPGFYSAIGRWLPNGAAVSALRDMTFFPAVSTTGSLLVLSGWAAIGLAVALVVSMHRQRSLPNQPANTELSTASRELAPLESPT